MSALLRPLRRAWETLQACWAVSAHHRAVADGRRALDDAWPDRQRSIHDSMRARGHG